MSRTLILFALFSATIMLIGCRAVEEKPVFWVPKRSEREQKAQEFADEMGKDAIEFLEMLAKKGIENNPEDYQLFLEEMAILIHTHHENSDELIREMVRKKLTEDPGSIYAFLTDVMDEEAQSGPGFAVQLEVYASKVVRDEMARLRQEGNIQKLQAQTNEIATLETELIASKAQLNKAIADLETYSQEQSARLLTLSQESASSLQAKDAEIVSLVQAFNASQQQLANSRADRESYIASLQAQANEVAAPEESYRRGNYRGGTLATLKELNASARESHAASLQAQARASGQWQTRLTRARADIESYNASEQARQARAYEAAGPSDGNRWSYRSVYRGGTLEAY